MHKKDFISLQIFYMKQLLEESFDLTRDPTSNGIWYGIDYYRACKAKGREDLLKPLIEEGSTFHGHGPKDFFTPVKDPESPTGYRIYTFALKKGAQASSAIRALQKGLSLLDCGNICYLASSLALLDILGSEKFDCLFDPNGPHPFILTGDPTSSISRLLPKQCIQSEQDILKGDICYFCNCKEYVAKHPTGEERGLSVLCSEKDPQKYLGFGLPPEGLERAKIESSLLDGFNGEPIEEAICPSSIWNHLYSKSLLCDELKSRNLVHSLRDRTLSWEEYQNNPGRMQGRGVPIDGKMALWVYRPDLLTLQQLADASLATARDLISII